MSDHPLFSFLVVQFCWSKSEWKDFRRRQRKESLCWIRSAQVGFRHVRVAATPVPLPLQSFSLSLQTSLFFRLSLFLSSSLSFLPLTKLVYSNQTTKKFRTAVNHFCALTGQHGFYSSNGQDSFSGQNSKVSEYSLAKCKRRPAVFLFSFSYTTRCLLHLALAYGTMGT